MNEAWGGGGGGGVEGTRLRVERSEEWLTRSLGKYRVNISLGREGWGGC